ncbi:hypothetical protein OBBRIDRAFT_147821 [Obba rivulosa]|uniref:DUF6535 domain-containing protein n=1 Tax=Obba rivulosa TaxID=1052685 RepID=A0A8E2AMU5_9APHY|nr:hypothetical protein OBBRIDRAFT_147821 [Obba rivulosa]
MMSDTASRSPDAARGHGDSSADGGEGTVLDAQIWRAYLDQASKADQETFAGWQSDMDTLLIFAALFSAVLTAFVIEAYPNLEPDDTQTTAQLLQAILLTLQSNASAASAIALSAETAFHAPASAVRVNVFWFASLIISVSVAFLAILAKQWIYNLSTGTSPIPVAGGRQRQYRRDGLNAWRLPAIITSLPVLLHIAVLLFFAGLLEFVWDLNSVPVAAVSTALVGIVVLAYGLTSSLSMLFPSCPYKSSLTSLILAGIDSTLRSLYTFVGITGSWLNRTGMTYIERLLDSLNVNHRVHGALSETAIATASANLVHNSRDAWHMDANSFLSPKVREDRRIHAEHKRLDAAVLAWMIEHSSQLEDVGFVARELCRFPELLAHRFLFLETNSAAMLLRHITSLYNAPFEGLLREQQTELLCTMDVLASLVTESLDADAPGAVSLMLEAYPYFYDFVDYDSYSDIIIPSILVPGKSPSAFEDTKNLHFFANAIRLTLPAISESTAEAHDPLSYIDEFYQRLSDPSEFHSLAGNARMACINTVLYIGTTAANERIEQLNAAEYGQRSLNVLRGILEHGHDFISRMSIVAFSGLISLLIPFRDLIDRKSS